MPGRMWPAGLEYDMCFRVYIIVPCLTFKFSDFVLNVESYGISFFPQFRMCGWLYLNKSSVSPHCQKWPMLLIITILQNLLSTL